MSTLKVNNLDTESGTTVTVTAGKTLDVPATSTLTVAGTATLTNATLALPVTLPATAGTNLTNIPGANITGTIPLAQLGNAPATDLSPLEDDIAVLGFQVAAASDLAQYNLRDQIVNTFQDTSGIDTAASTNEVKTLKYWTGRTVGNYFGAGAADTTYSTNTDLAVQNVQGSFDGDMVFAEYNTLTINAGVTLSTNVPCRGLFIYVKGNCVINGTINMTGKGAYANPGDTANPVAWGSAGSDGVVLGGDGLRLGLVKSGSTDTLTNDGTDFNGCGTAVKTAVTNQQAIAGNGKIYQVARQGAAGGVATSTAPTVGNVGTSGVATLTSGGGGSGGTSGSTTVSGAGSYGSCWGGGSGGAGVHNSTSAAVNAGIWGGAGGGGNFGGNAGGAGNPGGVGDGTHGNTGETGTGGAIWLIVGGTLSGSGTIISNGKNGGSFGQNSCGGGGGSGAGPIVVASVTDTSSITLTAAGGIGTVTGNGGGSRDGGNGGAGYTIKESGIAIVGGATTNNMTLVSTATTAEAGTTATGDLVILYDPATGSTTLNTDLVASVSRDNGTTYTAATLVGKGSYSGTTQIATAHDIDISGQPAGTSMRWKIATNNQGVSKETRINGVSLGWS